MKSYGHFNLQQNELQEAVIQIETNFPSTPVPGRLAFKDKVLYICVEIAAGLPVWIPLTNELNSHVHTQSTGSATWTITHNLNTTTPAVQLYGADNMMVMPNNVTVIDNNTVSVTFNVAITGRAVVIIGNTEGGARPTYTFTHTQTNGSATWVIPHNLGYMPIIRVFIGNQEVQPTSIVHDSNMQTTITFLTPQVGVARCI